MILAFFLIFGLKNLGKANASNWDSKTKLLRRKRFQQLSVKGMLQATNTIYTETTKIANMQITQYSVKQRSKLLLICLSKTTNM